MADLRRLATALMALLMALAGCQSSARISAENDRLRNEVIQLQARVTTLTNRNSELEAELKRAAAAPGDIPEEIRAVTPHVAGISIGRLSFAGEQKSGQSPHKALTIYIDPVDGMGRFTQLVGAVSINAAVLPPHHDAVTVGRMSFAPQQVREAYRSFITGVHYTFEVPIQIPDNLPAGELPAEITVRAQYTDGLTGQTFSAERAIQLK